MPKVSGNTVNSWAETAALTGLLLQLLSPSVCCCCCFYCLALLWRRGKSERKRDSPAETATWAAKAAKISTGFAPRLCDMYWLGLLVIGRPWRLRESWLKHSWSLLFSPDNFSKFQISSHPVFITHGPADIAFLNYLSTWSDLLDSIFDICSS